MVLVYCFSHDLDFVRITNMFDYCKCKISLHLLVKATWCTETNGVEKSELAAGVELNNGVLSPKTEGVDVGVLKRDKPLPVDKDDVVAAVCLGSGT